MKYPDEQELLISLHQLDLSSLTLLYERYSPGLFAYSFRLLGDESLAEDCVSETFFRFLNALKAGGGPERFLQAYLYRVAHNWITDHYRRQSFTIVELSENLPSNEMDQPEESFNIQMKQQQVRNALKLLTPDQRQVISLRFLEGWENEEVSHALHKPVGTIKVIQHRALTTLQKILFPIGENPNDEI